MREHFVLNLHLILSEFGIVFPSVNIVDLELRYMQQFQLEVQDVLIRMHSYSVVINLS